MRARLLGAFVVLGWTACAADVSATDDEPVLAQGLGSAADPSGGPFALFSATLGERFYPSSQEALDALAAKLRAQGVADPAAVHVLAQVASRDLHIFGWHHSELQLLRTVMAMGDAYAEIDMRVVGDPRGAGVFDGAFGSKAGPLLCLDWQDIERLVRAAYRPGTYAHDFVCHTITNYALRAIGAAPEYYAPRIGGWPLAMRLYGPSGDSGLSEDEATWEPVKACDPLLR